MKTFRSFLPLFYHSDPSSINMPVLREVRGLASDIEAERTVQKLLIIIQLYIFQLFYPHFQLSSAFLCYDVFELYVSSSCGYSLARAKQKKQVRRRMIEKRRQAKKRTSKWKKTKLRKDEWERTDWSGGS